MVLLDGIERLIRQPKPLLTSSKPHTAQSPLFTGYSFAVLLLNLDNVVAVVGMETDPTPAFVCRNYYVRIFTQVSWPFVASQRAYFYIYFLKSKERVLKLMIS